MGKSYDKKACGARIKHTRINRNITQEQLAENVSISISFLYGIESGIKKPSLVKLINIATELDESLDYIVFGNDYAPASSEVHIEIERMLSHCDIPTAEKVRDILKLILPML